MAPVDTNSVALPLVMASPPHKHQHSLPSIRDILPDQFANTRSQRSPHTHLPARLPTLNPTNATSTSIPTTPEVSPASSGSSHERGQRGIFHATPSSPEQRARRFSSDNNARGSNQPYTYTYPPPPPGMARASPYQSYPSPPYSVDASPPIRAAAGDYTPRRASASTSRAHAAVNVAGVSDPVGWHETFRDRTHHETPSPVLPPTPASPAYSASDSDESDTLSRSNSLGVLSNEYSRSPGSDDEKRHLCPYCPKRFNRPSSLGIHINTHTGDKPFRCPYPRCGKEFNVNSNMRRHYRNHFAASGLPPSPSAPLPVPLDTPSNLQIVPCHDHPEPRSSGSLSASVIERGQPEGRRDAWGRRRASTWESSQLDTEESDPTGRM